MNNYLNKQYDFSNLIFHDEFLFGGYGHSSNEELDILENVFHAKVCLLIRPIQERLFMECVKYCRKENSREKRYFFGIQVE